MEKITVFTIVYNNYGRFIPRWNDFLNNQTIKVKKMVVLGKNHGADLKFLEENNIKAVFCDSDNMGTLRNAGVRETDTEWWQYFAVDDELLPHACEEIVNTDADAVSLRFNVIETDGRILLNQHSPKITTVEELLNWKSSWGGYVAVRGHKDIKFREDIEVPNLTFHMDMFKRGLNVVESKTICVIHHRWSESHHFRSAKDGSRRKSVQVIDDYVEEILKEYKNTGNYMLIKAKENYIDNKLKKYVEKNEEYVVKKDRGEEIISAGYAVLLKMI